MKTKNKVIALVEIAVVLCSVFLVAIPAIAADQNTQEVSATEVTTASEDDYVLGIYGNANEDDTIDMGDVVYTKLAIFGKKPKTDLCDAKYDGRINVLDVIQTKLIILGKEKELTLVDTADRIVTVKKPIMSAVGSFILGILRSLEVDIKDIVVGVYSPVDLTIYPELSSVVDVGPVPAPDIEKIVELNPDVVILRVPRGGQRDTTPALNKLESAGITVLCFAFKKPEIHREEVRKLGYLFDRSDEAEKYLDWRENILNSISEKAEMIPEEDKVKVYFESSRPYFTCPQVGYIAEAGGKDIFAGEPCASVDPEAVIVRNPDVIVKVACPGGGWDMDADDTAELKALRDEILSRPELQNVKAVKNKRVYIITSYLLLYLSHCNYIECFQIAYQAKWFYPDLFEDLDPKAIHQEYLTKFQGLDIDLDEKGVFVYPEPS